MLRESSKRILRSLQQGSSGPLLAADSACVINGQKQLGKVFFRSLHASEVAVVPKLPLHPQLFDKAMNKSGGSWSLLHLWKRAFSSSPKGKGFENFIPKGHGSKGAASKAAGGGSGGPRGKGKGKDPGQVDLMASLNYLWLAVAAYYIWSYTTDGSANTKTHEISFQDFKAKLLAKGVVTRLEVANNNLVRVYVKPDAAASLAAVGDGGDATERRLQGQEQAPPPRLARRRSRRRLAKGGAEPGAGCQERSRDRETKLQRLDSPYSSAAGPSH
eukprot:gene3918-13991_t